MAAPIEFWFDFISPYAYLAWQRIHDLANTHERELVYRPVLFAGLLNHWGQLGPAEIPPKREFVFKQVSRRAHELGVPLQPPPSHPFNPLMGLRLASLGHFEHGERRRLIDLLFRATWGGGPGITDPDALSALLSAAGFDGEALLAATKLPETKQRLREDGELALRCGVFGVPTIIADGELFWGDDSFPEVDAFLSGDDPLERSGVMRWKDLPASADRRKS